MNWIDINKEKPKHKQTVLASSSKGFCVVVYIDSKIINDELSKMLYADECVNTDLNPFYFVSQEIKGHTLNGVTHWAKLVRPND